MRLIVAISALRLLANVVSLMTVIYRYPLYHKYLAERLSWAWLFKIAAWTAIVILPFVFAYISHDFWKKVGQYREQPSVRFQHKAVLVCEGYPSLTTAVTPQTQSPIVWSTIPEAQAAVGFNSIRAVQLKSAELDLNGDGVTDEIHFNITVPLNSGEVINRLSMLLFFQVRLQQRAQLTMESLIHISEQSPLPGVELSMMGDLYFQQLNPLSVLNSRTIYQSGLLDPVNITSVADLQFPVILARNFRRNESVAYSAVNSYWMSGVPGNDVAFSASLILRVPTQTISYTPEFGETIKFAWIQYLALFVPVAFAIDTIMWLVYTNQILDTLHTKDSNNVATKLHQF